MAEKLTAEMMITRMAALSVQRDESTRRFETSGDAHKAHHAMDIAATFESERLLWGRVAEVTSPLGDSMADLLIRSASCAITYCARMRDAWSEHARTAQRRADAVAERAAAAFNSGMTYVPGRGVVRAHAGELACDADAAEGPYVQVHGGVPLDMDPVSGERYSDESGS